MAVWLMGIAAAVVPVICTAPVAVHAEEVTPAQDVQLLKAASNVASVIETNAMEWIAAKDLPRSDGYAYTIDIGQLLIHFARSTHEETYSALREYALRNILIDNPQESYTKDFVTWRSKLGQNPDATGTTESLWLAKGLWDGAKPFAHPEDKDRVRSILAGYMKHQYVDNGIWMIRNYYNIGTKSYATNTYTVDYYPDFVAEVAKETGDKDLADLADNSTKLLERAMSPSGLIHTMIQPEITTMYPESNIYGFSPNDLVILSNACFAAETAVDSSELITKAMLKFTAANLKSLATYYRGSTGKPASKNPARGTELTCLVRMAALSGERDLTMALLRQALPFWKEFAANPYDPKLFVAGRILLAIDALERLKSD